MEVRLMPGAIEKCTQTVMLEDRIKQLKRQNLNIQIQSTRT